MEAKDQITILLKQYDAIRTEINEAIKVLSGINFTLMLALAAALFSAKGEMSLSLILLFVPAIFLLAFALSRKQVLELEDAASHLARVEDKLYRVTGQPLITHETEMLLGRSLQPRQFVKSQWFQTVFYFALELALFFFIDANIPVITFRTPIRWMLLVSAMLVPPYLLLHYNHYIMKNRKQWAETDLMKRVKEYMDDMETVKMRGSSPLAEREARTAAYEREKGLLAIRS